MDLKEKIQLENQKAKYKAILGMSNMSDEEFIQLAFELYEIASKLNTKL